MRAIKGGAVLVGVAVKGGDPRVVFSTFLASCVEGDRLSLEPYNVAAELMRDSKGQALSEAATAVAEGRKLQEQLAATGLHSSLRSLEELGCKPVVAALLVNRAGWITDLLAYRASWPEHVPVAEGLAVRDALRFAIKERNLELVELDEKSLLERASKTLGYVAIGDRSTSEGTGRHRW